MNDEQYLNSLIRLDDVVLKFIKYRDNFTIYKRLSKPCETTHCNSGFGKSLQWIRRTGYFEMLCCISFFFRNRNRSSIGSSANRSDDPTRKRQRERERERERETIIASTFQERSEAEVPAATLQLPTPACTAANHTHPAPRHGGLPH
jgi:hypothetical protein